MLAAAAFAAAMGAAQGLDLDLASRMEDVIDPRFFIILNGSNTDNVGQYVLGAIGVVLVLGLLLMLLLLAFGGAGGGGQGLAYNRYDQYEPDTYASYQNNYQPAQGFNGFQARSLAGAYDAIQVLYMLEQAFEKMRVLEFECQQRAVCETHQADAPQKFGQIATDIQKFIGSVDESTVENSSKFAAFREAARRGAEQQDCQQAYATKCPKGLREYLSAESKY
ncbi:uncharacterized protein LOC122391896 isoform X2 [Amphibalanus amphitrite]|uniref:uncharacterized protein LOC122370018 n=1 Tax=Amphibalanus amphitrite TaxID=1232801 RepID=UPI001C91AC9C|nr:uncharacterized protein LOC122370018 [Amphibalanus amphitrite]XP_043242156.1 uncharacterized protein LOC122391896 isoform X2 [Amphibalanus amphitrite]